MKAKDALATRLSVNKLATDQGRQPVPLSVNQQPRNSKPHFGRILHKERRHWEYAPGNRNDFASARYYYALLGGWEQAGDELLAHHAAEKSPGEARYIRARTSALVDTMTSRALRSALIAYRSNSITKDRHVNGARVLMAMMRYARTSDYCSAKHGSIANSIGLSRQAVTGKDGWIALLEKSGLIERVGYDYRGTVSWRGREIAKWCIVYQLNVSFDGRFSYSGGSSGHGGYTIPKWIYIAPELPTRRLKHRCIPIDDWWDIQRCIGPPKIMESIHCWLVGRDDASPFSTRTSTGARSTCGPTGASPTRPTLTIRAP